MQVCKGDIIRFDGDTHDLLGHVKDLDQAAHLILVKVIGERVTSWVASFRVKVVYKKIRVAPSMTL